MGNKNHKQTAWKKNREFGDRMGGRLRLKMHDNIFAREHSFTAPSELDETPIFMHENTSRNYFFPISVDDVKDALGKYPPEEVCFITHVWLRKHVPRKKCWAEYITGSGVYLMTIYPMRKDCRWYLGKQRPFGKELNEYKRFARICQEKDGWYAQFTEESSRDYYIEILLPFCINGFIEKYKVSESY